MYTGKPIRVNLLHKRYQVLTIRGLNITTKKGENLSLGSLYIAVILALISPPLYGNATSPSPSCHKVPVETLL